ncbi:uncharacterized protein LOC125647869 isoform X2 [Ostrea edulis]|uniref:uncharacterized protein LOC125647869 isoform X2 n=1 Tax=Ostrea edulis TaxID=37623 RepID=UPI0024AEE7B4|nr:uncharacterized protein LOC125647869 isoform X2 [Ostrea edulis]
MTGRTDADMSLTLLVMMLSLSLNLRYTVSGRNYLYVDRNRSWSEAIEFCRQEEAFLSTLNQEVVGSALQTCLPGNSTDLWTNTYSIATPYLLIHGCVGELDNMTFHTLNSSSVFECQTMCSNYSRFAIKSNDCACLHGNESLGVQKDASLCNVICEEQIFCGGIDTVNIYDVGGFLSCSFEPEDTCFLIQDTHDDFDWEVKTAITGDDSVQAYEGSYFAYTDGSQSSSGHRAVLYFNVEPEDYNWCLRFRYYINSEYTTLDVIIYSTLENVTHTLEKSLQEEWKYKECDIKGEDFRVAFLVELANEMSMIALDDVTMVVGRCAKTSTALLNMKGGLNCNFEGNVDICFDQDKSDDFDWTIKKGKTPSWSTGPSKSIEGNYYSYIEVNGLKNGAKAVLMSKFEINDALVNFSMQYNMYGSHTGSLKVFYKDISGKERNIFDVSGDQGNMWRQFTNIMKVVAQSKVYIEASKGTGRRSDIAVDDIRIRIIGDDSADGYGRSWMNASQRCIRNLGSYPIGSREITNLACLSDGPERWTGVIRARRMGSATEVFSGYPTAVQTFRISRNITMNIWRPYESNESRSFVCESERIDSSETCRVYEEESHVFEYASEESNETPFIAVTIVIVLAMITTITLIVMIIYFRRRKGLKCKQHDDVSGTEVLDVTYMNTEETMSIQNSVYTEKKSKNVSIPENSAKFEMGDSNADEIYANQENMQLRTRLDEQDARMKHDEQEDYDHLHSEKSEMTSTTDDVYSHMTNNQNRVTSTTNDVYSHMNNNQNRVTSTTDDVYSHMTNNQNRVTLTTDDVYSHMTNNGYGSQEMIVDSTYDHAARVDSEYGGSQISKDVNETYDHAGFNAPDEM